MKAPPVDLPYLRERLRELAGQLRDAWESASPGNVDEETPTVLSDALLQLFDMLAHVESDAPSPTTAADAVEINTLGEYGLNLLDELSQIAAGLDQPVQAAEIEGLSLPYALWIARHGGEIRHLRPVVNALARLANEASRPAAMSSLYVQCCELIEATSPAVEDVASRDPHHPWRLLLLNRAIVATRSHNVELMEAAFDAIVECLPHDARGFFAEGMEQMSIIDYPDHVRDVVRNYFLAHAVPKRLH